MKMEALGVHSMGFKVIPKYLLPLNLMFFRCLPAIKFLFSNKNMKNIFYNSAFHFSMFYHRINK